MNIGDKNALAKCNSGSNHKFNFINFKSCINIQNNLERFLKLSLFLFIIQSKKDPFF